MKHGKSRQIGWTGYLYSHETRQVRQIGCSGHLFLHETRQEQTEVCQGIYIHMKQDKCRQTGCSGHLYSHETRQEQTTRLVRVSIFTWNMERADKEAGLGTYIHMKWGKSRQRQVWASFFTWNKSRKRGLSGYLYSREKKHVQTKRLVCYLQSHENRQEQTTSLILASIFTLYKARAGKEAGLGINIHVKHGKSRQRGWSGYLYSHETRQEQTKRLVCAPHFTRYRASAD